MGQWALAFAVLVLAAVVAWAAWRLVRRLERVEGEVRALRRVLQAGPRTPEAADVRDPEAVAGVSSRLSGAAGWVRQARRALDGSPGWAAALLALHLALLGVWAWSREGSTTTLQLRVVGDRYQARVDGRLLLDGTVPGASQGGFGLDLRGNDALPTGSGTPRVERVRITDAWTGAVLFEDDLRGAWRWAEGGPWEAGRVPPRGGRITTGPRPWTDYEVEAVVANAIGVDTLLRYQDSGSFARLGFRPFRDLDSGLLVRAGGRDAGSAPGGRVRLEPTETVKGIVAVALRPYPWFLLGVAAIALALVRLGRSPWPSAQATGGGSAARVHGAPAWPGPIRGGRLHRAVRRWPGWEAGVLALALATLTFAALAYTGRTYLDGIPHVPDSAIYAFQAKMFAAGMLAAPAPPVPEAFDIFGSYLAPYRGLWVSQYPFGHPLVLALGYLLGQPWIVPPLVGAATVLVVFQVGRMVHGPAVGLLAAALLALSPFFQMNGAEYMSHMTAALYASLAVLGLVGTVGGRTRRRRVAAASLCGVALGLLFNTRALSAAGVGLVVLAALVGHAARRRQVPRAEWVAFGAGGGLLLVAYLGYNTALTGDPLLNPYSFSGTLSRNVLGFGGELTPERAVSNVYTSLTLLDVVLLGLPPGLALLLPLLPYLLGSRRAWDYVFLGLVLGIAAAWFFYVDPFIMYGPRFWFETTPFLALLAGRGLWLAFDRAHRLARWSTRRFSRVEGRRSLGEALVAPTWTAGVLGVAALALWGWWGPPPADRPELTFVPRNVRELVSFNWVDDRLLRLVRQRELRNAVVLVADCGGPWWCYGSVFPQNEPLLQSDVVYARERGPRVTAALRRVYPGRAFYHADYNRRTLEPLTAADAAAPAPGVRPP